MCFAFHYRNHKIVLMTKYWALCNKILDHITGNMVSHLSSRAVMQTNCVCPCVHLYQAHFPVCVCVCVCAYLNVTDCQADLL